MENIEVVVRFTLTRKELVAAIWHVQLRQLRTLFLLFAALANLAVGIWLQLATNIGISVGILVLVTLFPYVQSAIQFRRKNDVVHEQTHIFSDEKIRVILASSEGTMKWDFYTSFLDVGSLYLLRRGRRVYNLIPKRAFQDESAQEQFRALCRTRTKANF